MNSVASTCLGPDNLAPNESKKMILSKFQSREGATLTYHQIPIPAPPTAATAPTKPAQAPAAAAAAVGFGAALPVSVPK